MASAIRVSQTFSRPHTSQLRDHERSHRTYRSRPGGEPETRGPLRPFSGRYGAVAATEATRVLEGVAVGGGLYRGPVGFEGVVVSYFVELREGDKRTRMILYDASEIRVQHRPIATGIPSGAYVEYFGHLPAGDDFVIFRPKADWDYTDFRCVVSGKAVEVKKVVRYRDGGTTDIETAIGNFHFPTPFKPEEKPTFNGEVIVVYDR